ncbi:MAG: GIY-YIG nuclease family protein [Nitrospirae bacterium]|nr:GIY-YIG nuclease family protein [Nitrospirota bacterium]
MAQGKIYVLTNPSMPGLVKVGKTIKESSDRAAQLSSATGVPNKFEVYKEYEVSDCEEAERFAHSILERVFGRPNASREFFEGNPAHISSHLDEALSSRLVKYDQYTISDFESAISRLNKKEFTMGCIEFESLFKDIQLTESKISTSIALQKAASAYLACCYAKGKRPVFTSVLAPNIKGIVTERAIKFAEAFESEPTTNMIRYLRSIEEDSRKKDD